MSEWMIQAGVNYARASSSQLSPSTQEWVTLQHVCVSAKAITQKLQEWRCRFTTAASADRVLWENAAQIQSKEIEISLLNRRLHSTRKRIRLLHIRLTATNEVEEANGNALAAIREAVASDSARIECGSIELELLRTDSVHIWNKLTLRRLYMFGELRTLLLLLHQKPTINSIIQRFTQNHGAEDGGLMANRQKWPLIESPGRAVSLAKPEGTASDAEIYACAGYLVNFLDCASQIFDLPLKHFVRFRGSNSALICRQNNERFNLYGGPTRRIRNDAKKSAERLKLALTMLSDNFNELFRALQSVSPSYRKCNVTWCYCNDADMCNRTSRERRLVNLLPIAMIALLVMYCSNTYPPLTI